MREARAASGRSAVIETYPCTTRWFAEEDWADVYDSLAAELAWQRTMDFLRRELCAAG